MKVVLTEALHARPANLLVRLAARYASKLELHVVRCARKADGKSVLDVLALGAAVGDELELMAEGDDAAALLDAIAELVARRFDADLVPELATGAVEGIGAGRAVVIGDVESGGGDLSLDEAVAAATRELDALIACLPPAEAKLFGPVRPVLLELAENARARVAAGDPLAFAILEGRASAMHDVVNDAQERLLDALNGGDDARAIEHALEEVPADQPIVVVVARPLTPTLVARLPRNVTAIVTEESNAAGTSHAAILARGRGLALVRVPEHVLASLEGGQFLLVDTTVEPSRVWVAPSETLVKDARGRRDAREATRASGTAASIDHLPVVLRVNLGSIRDEVPAGAAGVGLLRTELAFAGRAAPPSMEEHWRLITAVSKKARLMPVVVRLFDAGADKPLAWLPPSESAPHARGVELLLSHPEVLESQLHGIAAAASGTRDIRVLIPYVRSADDVKAIRERLPRALPVGAMIETSDAAHAVDAIAEHADFLCIGTNDLAASALGVGRGDASSALHPDVLGLVRLIVERARAAARGLTVTVCGEIAGDPRGAKILIGFGVDALSVAPARLGDLRRALAAVTLDDCRAAAEEALKR